MDRTRTYNRLPRAWMFHSSQSCWELSEWTNFRSTQNVTKNLILEIKVFPLFRDSQPAVSDGPSLLSVQQLSKWEKFLPPSNFFRLVNGEKKCLISFFFLFSFIHIFSFIHLVSAVVWKTVECVVYFVVEWWCFFVWSKSLTIYETIFQPILRATREIQSRDIELFAKKNQFDANLPQSFLFSSCNGHVVLGEWKETGKKSC